MQPRTDSWPTQLEPPVGTELRLVREHGCLVLCGPVGEQTGDVSEESQDKTVNPQLISSCCFIRETSAQPAKGKITQFLSSSNKEMA